MVLERERERVFSVFPFFFPFDYPYFSLYLFSSGSVSELAKRMLSGGGRGEGDLPRLREEHKRERFQLKTKKCNLKKKTTCPFTHSTFHSSSSPFLCTAATSHEPFLLPILHRSREKTSVDEGAGGGEAEAEASFPVVATAVSTSTRTGSAPLPSPPSSTLVTLAPGLSSSGNAGLF